MLARGFSQANNQLVKLNVRGNSLTDIDVKNMENLQYLNCADNSLSLVALGNHPQLQVLVAKNNSKCRSRGYHGYITLPPSGITQLEISTLCKQLTSIDLSQ